MSINLLGKTFAIPLTQYQIIEKKLENIKKKIDLGLTSDCPFDPDFIVKALDDLERGKFYNSVENKTLRLITGAAQKLSLDKTDGTATIANSEKVFIFGVTSDFKKNGPWKLDRPSKATNETNCQIFHLDYIATYFEIFNLLSKDFDLLCFTQHQIVNFCRRYSFELIKAQTTAFLFKSDKEYFIAAVYARERRQYKVDFDYLVNSEQWGPYSNLQIVIPFND